MTEIANENGRLSDEEFEHFKALPVARRDACNSQPLFVAGDAVLTGTQVASSGSKT
ncbi:hypothetical protein ACFWVC_32305 [Streptomyces sp. NPDC058691]|uniref:hypothetical protein n=1 Tax=Streptomyces sp. NPDC058691 TaxID=3346601 RepID=UPI0036632A0A